MSDWTGEHKEQQPAAFVEPRVGFAPSELNETRRADLTVADTTELTGTGAAELKDAASSSAFESAFCGSLRSKKFFMRDGLLAKDAGDYLDASNHCWCRETHQVIGPDGGRAQPSRCVSGRACYNSALKG